MIFYLAADALCLGLMATALCMSFFPSGLIRIALMTVLFPLLSVALCAWMTVFGFYLRLEDIARRLAKRKAAKKALLDEKGIDKYFSSKTSLTSKPISSCPAPPRSTEFVNLAFEDA